MENPWNDAESPVIPGIVLGLGKGEAESSNLSGSTIKPPAFPGFLRRASILSTPSIRQNAARTNAWTAWKIRGIDSRSVLHTCRLCGIVVGLPLRRIAKTCDAGRGVDRPRYRAFAFRIRWQEQPCLRARDVRDPESFARYGLRVWGAERGMQAGQALEAHPSLPFDTARLMGGTPPTPTPIPTLLPSVQ